MTFVANTALSAAALNAAFDAKWTIWSGTQAAYDAISVKDSKTLYVITG